MGKVKIKTVLLGDSGVGKTSIAVRLARDVFNDRAQPTVGAAFFTFVVENEADSIQFEMWDTAGQERFRNVMSSYYRGAQGIAVVYVRDACHYCDCTRYYIYYIYIVIYQSLLYLYRYIPTVIILYI